MSVQLGDKVRDRATGFVGIAMTRVDFATGNVQFTLQPPVSGDNKIPASETFDQHYLEVVEHAVLKPVAPELQATALLGKKLRDVATGAEGNAVRATTFLNGCIYFSCYGKADTKGVYVEHFLDAMRVEVVSEGIVKKLAAIAKAHTPKAVKKAVPTGGPVFSNPARG